MPVIAAIFPRETQDFASTQGGRQYYFHIKHAALGNLKASFHCAHWQCFSHKTNYMNYPYGQDGNSGSTGTRHGIDMTGG